MVSRNRYEEIDTYAAALIRHKAGQLVGRAGFSPSDREDLEQDLMLDLLRRLRHFDPARARLETFMARVVNHKASSLIEARMAGCRDYRLCTCSINDPLRGSTERGELIDQDDYLRRTGRVSRPTEELRDLRIDSSKAMERLPMELRDLCYDLGNDSITRISRNKGVPRATIYDQRKRLQVALEGAGLRDYL